MKTFKQELTDRAETAKARVKRTLQCKYAAFLVGLDEILRRAADAGEFQHTLSVSCNEQARVIQEWAAGLGLESVWSSDYVTIRW